MEFKIGADPELFLMRNGSFISAEDRRGPLIPGTKKAPFKVKGGAIQVDGVAAEFNVDPGKTFPEFFENLKSTLSALKERVKAVDPAIKLVPVPTATFPKMYFDALPEHTKELGCEPDFSAYTMQPNPRPKTNQPFRTGSGHIHIGWTDKADPNSVSHMLDCQLVTKELDKYLHFASLSWDSDTKRQELYGKPGSFRPKPYGMEYRPLSNAWLRSTDTVYGVYKITMGVMRSIDSGRHDFDRDLTKMHGKTNLDKSLMALSEYVWDL